MALRSEPPPELAAELRAHPEDVRVLAVYADWLQEQGDARGGLLALELANAASRKLDAYIKQHREALLGPLADCKQAKATWRHGCLHAVRVQVDATVGQTLAAIAEHRDAARIATLGFVGGSMDALVRTVAALLAHAPDFPALRTLSADFYSESEMIDFGRLAPVYRVLRGLEHLELACGDGDVSPVPVQLRSFAFTGTGSSSYDLGAILAARWPRLERFMLRADCLVAPLRDFVQRRDLPALRELALPDFGDVLCDWLAESPLAAQLEVIELGRPTAVGIRTLVRARDRFAQLRRLVLVGRRDRQLVTAFAGVDVEVT